MNDKDEDLACELPMDWRANKKDNLFQFKYNNKKEGKLFFNLIFSDKMTFSINCINSEIDDDIYSVDINIEDINLEQLDSAVNSLIGKISAVILDKIDPIIQQVKPNALAGWTTVNPHNQGGRPAPVPIRPGMGGPPCGPGIIDPMHPTFPTGIRDPNYIGDPFVLGQNDIFPGSTGGIGWYDPNRGGDLMGPNHPGFGGQQPFGPGFGGQQPFGPGFGGQQPFGGQGGQKGGPRFYPVDPDLRFLGKGPHNPFGGPGGMGGGLGGGGGPGFGFM